jgi:hypothetical protein
MSQITVNAGGIAINLDFGSKNPLPQIDPLTGAVWQQQGRGSGSFSWAQPGTADNSLTAPQSNPVIFKSPA